MMIFLQTPLIIKYYRFFFPVICHHSNVLFSTTYAAANVENTQWSVDDFPQYSLLTWGGGSGGGDRKCVGVGFGLLP